MECLQIPVDHRLRRTIRRGKLRTLDVQCDKHVRLLRDFGQSISFEDGSPLPVTEVDFACDLAGPSTVGGIVVALDQPSASQTFEGGVATIVDSCATLKAVQDLIVVTSNRCFTLNDVSVFDALPIMTEKYDCENDTFEAADSTFLDMCVAKRPDVIISCFRAQSSNGDICRLQTAGVGKSVTSQTKVTIQGVPMRKIDVFHPSYAVNYNPEYSCFRQLLILEFAQAFGVVRNDWEDLSWMKDLRRACREETQRILKSPDASDLELWRRRLAALDNIFTRTNFFRILSFSTKTYSYDLILRAGLTWRLCDAGLFMLEAALSTSHDIEVINVTREMFMSWVKRAWGGFEIELNKLPGPGMFEHNQLVDLSYTLKEIAAQHLHSILVRFLRDANLSFTWDADEYSYNLKAQADAFLRYAKSLEDILELISPEDGEALAGDFRTMRV